MTPSRPVPYTNADPDTLRLLANQLAQQAVQLERQADRIERETRNSIARPFRPARAARLANAMIAGGMNPQSAILLASAKASCAESTTRAALEKLQQNRRERQKARTIAKARALIAGGMTIRETAATLDMPKSTLADWLR